jgi:hypothetical protein
MSGLIPRRGYTYVRKSGTVVHVAPGFVKNTGLPGKGFRGEGKGIGRLKKNVLGPFGYHNIKTMSEAERHLALKRAIGHVPTLRIIRGLRAVATYQKYKNPNLSKIYLKNREFVKSL